MSEAGQQSQTDQTRPIQRKPAPIIGIIGSILGIVGLFVYQLPCGIAATILGVASYAREKTAVSWLAIILGIADIVQWLFLFGIILA
jgi:hypothetical protein